MKSISSFEIIDHGIDHAQYFQGCGVSFTEFEYVVTGYGQNAKEAFSDALDQIVNQDFEIKTIAESREGDSYDSDGAEQNSVAKYLESQNMTENTEDIAEDSELGYYLSIRWK